MSAFTHADPPPRARIPARSSPFPRPAQHAAAPSVSVVIPTYREAENLPELLSRLDGVRASMLAPMDVVIVDDDSGDGAESVVRACAMPWARVIVRRGERGLSSAVIAGLCAAAGEILVVMDADLSHPPESIPDLVQRVVRGADFVVGSRYVPGGSVDEHWGWGRRLNSRVAAILARPLVTLSDPLSGFFALRRSTFRECRGLNPIGYKIGLELMVRCRCTRIEEAPIRFTDRRRGVSKLSIREQWNYLRHVGRLLLDSRGRA
jgi:dolichol-phosphate mannosyltransferase